MRALDCLDSPVDEPDEEHATAQVLNAKERMDPAWRMQIVHVVRADSARHQRREKGNEDMRKIAKKRSEVLTLHARLGRRDKANWRSLAPLGRKGLSAHWILQVLAASTWRGAKCVVAALRTFPMNFNLVRDGARNVRR